MESPFACDMNALTEEQRNRHGELARRIRPAVVEFLDLPDGYAARFEPEPDVVRELAEFMTLERLCCPFLTLGLRMERENGPLFLTVTGPEGVKPFIRAEFGVSEKPDP